MYDYGAPGFNIVHIYIICTIIYIYIYVTYINVNISKIFLLRARLYNDSFITTYT